MNEDADKIAEELVAAWPGWCVEAAQAEYDDGPEGGGMGNLTLRNLVGDFLRKAACRIRGHDEVVWYNPGGAEPNMRCQCCGENIG